MNVVDRIYYAARHCLFKAYSDDICPTCALWFAAADRIAELEDRIDNLTGEVANAREARP